MTTNDQLERSLSAHMAELGRLDATNLIADVVDRSTGAPQRSAWRQTTWWLSHWPGFADTPPMLLGPRRAYVLLALLFAALLAVVAGQALAPRPAPFTIRATYEGIYVPAGSLPGDVPFDTFSALPDGRVLVLAATVPRAASILDPATGRLEPTGRSAAWRSYPATFQLTDGRTLILGGDITPDRSGATSGSVGPSTAEVYDPAAGTFSSLGPTVIPRWQEATTVLKDGRVFVTGGVVAPVQGTTPIASTEFFDPSTLTFGAGPAMTVARNGHSMATLSDGRVLIVGGTWQDEDNSREIPSAELYDPQTGGFDTTGAFPDRPAPIRGYRYPVGELSPVVALPDGRALIPGLRCQEVHDTVDGVSAGSEPTQAILFDPATSTFRAPTMSPHCVSRAISLPNGQVLLTGWWYVRVGGAEGDRQVNWSGLYDPATDQIRLTAAPPGGPYMRAIVMPDGGVLTSNDGNNLELFR